MNPSAPGVTAASPTASVAWFHCFSGVAGDMALGSLVDAGADLDEVRALCDRLPVYGWELTAEPVQRGGVAATRTHVRVASTTVVRTAGHITAMIDEARLPDRVRVRAQGTFEGLAQAEARLHRRPVETVHFHELGALDTIIEVVGTCAALEVLGIDEVYASSVALGRGMVRRPHGLVPVPAPRTIELLRNAPTHGVDVARELTTPTGAAILAATVTGWGDMPAMTVRASGYGAGEADLDGRPNVTQVILGDRGAELTDGQPVMLLETTVDDVNGEILALALTAMVDAGAHEAWITPITLSRGRPAHTLSALVDPALAAQVAVVMQVETGSLSIRARRLEKWPLARQEDEVDVGGRRVRVKVSAGRVKVEHDDAARAARHIGIPVREVVSLAEEAWRRRVRGGMGGLRSLNPVTDPDPDPGPGPTGADPDDDIA